MTSRIRNALRHTRPMAAVLATLGAGAGATAQNSHAQHSNAQHWDARNTNAQNSNAQNSNATTIARVELRALNNSGAQGRAMLRLSGDGRALMVNIRATGLEPGGVHVSHLHGLSQGGQAVDSTCPTQAQDADGDSFVELDEGGVTYGPILVDFGNIDPDGDGTVDFSTTVTLTGDQQKALPLNLRHIVVHGRTVLPGAGAGTPGEVDGTNGYLVVLPVLCGEIDQAGSRR